MPKKDKIILPTATRDDHNNPEWTILLPVRVCRMDNSLSMDEHVGDFKNSKGEVLGSIGKPLGGLAFTLHFKDKNEPRGHYGVDVRAAINEVLKMDKELRKVPKMKNERKEKSHGR